MRALFNHVCHGCNHFMPRCAYVYLRRPGKATAYSPERVALCEGCRRERRGAYRLDVRHK